MYTFKLNTIANKEVKRNKHSELMNRLLVEVEDLSYLNTNSVQTIEPFDTRFINITLSDRACLRFSKLHIDYECTYTELMQALIDYLSTAPIEFKFLYRHYYN